MTNWTKHLQKKSLGVAPTETSPNIQQPELAPRDNRWTGRTQRISFTCRPSFATELKKLAREKDCYQIQILEEALELYKQKR